MYWHRGAVVIEATLESKARGLGSRQGVCTVLCPFAKERCFEVHTYICL
jgi:hypothetical protein